MDLEAHNTIYGNILFQTGVIEVVGADSHEFLQRLVSADISNMQSGTNVKSLLLDPNGKTISAFWIHRLNDERFYLVCEPYVLDRTIETLKRFCIRTKAEIIDISENYCARITTNSATSNDTIILEEDLYTETGLILEIAQREEGLTLSRELYEKFRIMHGVPSFKKDLGDNSIAQEASLDKSAISFDKGCFLGQELVCRIDSRGAKTPFGFFFMQADLLNTDVDKVDLLYDGNPFGEITSGLEVDAEYFAIIKVPRKYINDDGQLKEPINISSERLKNIKISRTIGNFSC